MMRLFHVTTLSALADIEKEGLVATIGPRAKKAGETIKKVWCYTSLNDLKALAEKDFGTSHGQDKLIAIEFQTSQVRSDDMKTKEGEELNDYVFELGLLKNVLASELVCVRDLSTEGAPVFRTYRQIEGVQEIVFASAEHLAERLFASAQEVNADNAPSYEDCLKVALRMAA